MDLSLVYFPSAVTLGALHALEPGHAKTLTAAYLIGTKGTKWDATVLGLSVAITHSFVVVALCVIAVMLGREAFTGEASYYLALGSSVIVIMLGAWLLRRRLRAIARAKTFISTHHHHSNASSPVGLKGNSFSGTVEIIQTEQGERLHVVSNLSSEARVTIIIQRDAGAIEAHELVNSSVPGEYFSNTHPEEPHEFSAQFIVNDKNSVETLTFEIHEPEDHDHDHALLSDDEHAKAHAANMPEYVARGERPTFWQIVTFGAAGGLVPCPAAISVMLLALSLHQSGKGIILVLGFGIGLAITLVGVGLLVVTGISKLASGGRFSKFSAYAPALAACMVILSGTIGLIAALIH